MKVALITHFYPAHGGGIELVAQQVAGRLAASHACDIVWLASDSDPPPELAGVSVQPMRTWNAVERLTGMPYPLWSPGSLRRLARAIREADAVHVHDCIYQGSLVAATLARWYGKRLVVTQHIGQVPIRNPLLRYALAALNPIAGWLVLGRAQAVVFISLVVKAYFERLLGRRTEFTYFPNGVDTTVFRPGELAKGELRSRLGLDPARPVLLFVGRFVPKKRLPVVRALAAARQDWQWCLIGEGPEDPRSWRLPNVQVRDRLDHAALADSYRAADLLVLPSEGEGFPLVVQEAMACGLPVCCSREVASAGALSDGVWAEITPTNGVAAVEKSIASIDSLLSLIRQSGHETRRACLDQALMWSWERCTNIYANELARL